MFFFGGSSQRSRFLMKNSQCLLVFQHRRTLDIGLCIALTIVFVQFFYKQKPYAIIKTLKILQLSDKLKAKTRCRASTNLHNSFNVYWHGLSRSQGVYQRDEQCSSKCCHHGIN